MQKIIEDDLRVIHRMCRHLQETFTKPESIYVLSLEFGMSVAKLTHLFKQVNGLTIRQYVIKHRIEKSQQLLLSTEQTIPVIAKIVGYKDWSAFTRAFKRITGITPTAYREKNSKSA